MEEGNEHEEHTFKFIDYLNRRKELRKSLKAASPIQNFLKNTDLKLIDEEKPSEMQNTMKRKGADQFIQQITAIKTFIYQRISSKYKEDLEKRFQKLVRLFNEADAEEDDGKTNARTRR